MSGIKVPRGKPRIGDAGRLSESRLARQLGARLMPASGAVQGIKGDMELPGYKIEAKASTNRSIGLQHSWLAKIVAEARAYTKKPLLMISFITGDGRPVPNGQWVVIPLKDWEELMEAQDAGAG
jgi:hypothetical protein